MKKPLKSLREREFQLIYVKLQTKKNIYDPLVSNYKRNIGNQNQNLNSVITKY